MASKITADGDYSHKIDICLLLGRKGMTKPKQHIKKQRHYFADKGPSSQSYGVSSSHIWMWELDYKENWIKFQRLDPFELWCWRRLLRVHWTVRRSNQYILKEISPEYSLKGLMLKLQYFGHLMRRTDSMGNTLVLGKIEGRRRRRGQRMRWLDGITDSVDMVWASSRSWWWTGKPGVLQSMGSQRVGNNWVTELRHLIRNHPAKKRVEWNI